jgi:phosphoserine phosphatase
MSHKLKAALDHLRHNTALTVHTHYRDDYARRPARAPGASVFGVKIAPEAIAKMRKLQVSGWTHAQISASLNVAAATVTRYLGPAKR